MSRGPRPKCSRTTRCCRGSIADHRPIYGGFFWVKGDGSLPIPKNTYYMAGAGGQRTVIIPSHDLVVVRLGHYKAASAGLESLKNALALLMKAVPSRR